MTLWYKFLLAAWCLTVIPIAILAYGFSGGHYVFPDIGAMDFGGKVNFFAFWACALSPLLLAPFGLRRRP